MTLISDFPCGRLQRQTKKTILEYLPLADIVKISDEELEFLTGTNSDDAVFKLFCGNVKLIFVTYGSRGSKMFTKQEFLFVNSIKVNAVDATGAGDAFWGGVLYKLTEHNVKTDNINTSITKEVMRDILTFANVSGALTATRRGAISSLPRYE
jgi:Sugar kinases, ribokinase family